ncbi:MAG: class I tRNA ligase family protein, partial [Campylobacter sp.]|nr:class I tRNA ligase family protein [Campylobacter sp.]
NDAASAIYRFFLNELCDWGIELSKADKSAVAELGSIFKESMKLLHPFMPFISEHLWHKMSGTSLESGAKSVMIMRYPVAGGQNESQNEKIEKLFNLVIESIVSIRRAKAVVDLGNAKIAKAFLRSNTDLSEFSHFIKLLAKCENVEFISEIKAGCVRDVSQNVESFIELAGIDTAPILKRLNAQKTKLEKEIAKLSAMLNNEKFVANAPADVLATNKEALQIATSKLEKVSSEIESLENV